MPDHTTQLRGPFRRAVMHLKQRSLLSIGFSLSSAKGSKVLALFTFCIKAPARPSQRNL